MPVDTTPASTAPEWMEGLAERVRVVMLPTAQLADAMRARREDPRDEALWRTRIDQLDTVLFGRPVRQLHDQPEHPSQGAQEPAQGRSEDRTGTT
jgi:hypothetical protein